MHSLMVGLIWSLRWFSKRIDSQHSVSLRKYLQSIMLPKMRCCELPKLR